MLDETSAKTLASRVLSRCAPDAGELILESGDDALVRLADGAVVQSVAERNVVLSLLLRRGGRIARAEANQADDAALDGLVNRARAMLDVQPEDPDLLPPAEPVQGSRFTVHSYDREPNREPGTACPPKLPEERRGVNGEPTGRAAAAGIILDACQARGVRASGIVETRSLSTSVASTLGGWAHHAFGRTEVAVSALSASGAAGAEERVASRLEEIPVRALAETAADRAAREDDPVEVPPGPWTVILESQPVADLLLHLGAVAFNGLAAHEGRSPLSGRVGQSVASPLVTIRDDALHPDQVGLPFDYEGTPRRRLALIEKGVLRSFVEDRVSARLGNTATTGHALPQPNAQGPLPLNLVLDPGDAPLAAMIASTEKGLLVTQFHYTNVVDPKQGILTGMTRGGTFLIEGGRVTRRIRNLRYTENAIEALTRIEAVGREASLHGGWFGPSGMLAPPLKIRDFNFSSVTRF